MTLKKRELLPKLNKVITELAALTGDVAKLELVDNEQASKRVRKALIEIANIHLPDLKNEITNIRVDINTTKGREIKRPKKETIQISNENTE
jgi:hypothetical protein